jgi:hypothetical protein
MPERSRPVLLARRALAWSIGWVFSAALYLLLIDITDLPELIVGAGAALLAATGLELAREQGLVGESISIRWLPRFYKPVLKVAVDVALVSGAAFRAVLHRDPHLGGSGPSGSRVTKTRRTRAGAGHLPRRWARLPPTQWWRAWTTSEA